MSFKRTMKRVMARNDDRLDGIVTGKVKAGITNSPRMAIAGNNHSVGKQAKLLQRRMQRMVKHARLVVGLLIRAAGGNAPLVLVR